MNSRDQILKAIASNKPELTELPSISFPATEGIDLREKLRAVLTGIGGQYIEIASRQELQEYIDSLGKNPGELVLGLPGWDGNNLDAYASKTATELDPVDTVVLRGELAVAENAAVWVPENNMGHRMLPFIAQHLVLIVEEKNIVPTMHDAYARLRTHLTGYGAFIAGPSKTADIEQSLVVGAHGPLSMRLVVEIGMMNNE